jgi:TPR repeat protein
MIGPYPIRALVRRARNAKSPKERHDTAYFAWEASVRVAVADRPPADRASLVLPSTGHWVAALACGEAAIDDAALLRVASLFAEIAQGKPSSPRSVLPRKLLDGLAAYRNQIIGHGSTRAAEFYDDAAQKLLDGLAVAWEKGIFLAEGARLSFVESVEIDAAGKHRARVLDLSGDTPLIADPRGTEVGADVLPQRLYLRKEDDFHPLHPWLLYEPEELRERVLFFNGRGRSSSYLDYVGGESLKGKALSTRFPALEDDVSALFAGTGAKEPPAAKGEKGEKGEPRDPNLFGDYRILGKLGQGGMGIVYLAQQTSLGRLVALKVQSPDSRDDAVARARFDREVRALSRCDHPNVVKILASGETDGKPYYVMELVEGADLGQLAVSLGSSRTLAAAITTASDGVRSAKQAVFADVPLVRRAAPVADAAEAPSRRIEGLTVLFRDAAKALGALHAAGVLHRDIKPGNLMVTAVDRRVVVMDLGLAALSDASQALTKDAGALLGTLRYMPPEQLQRSLLDIDARADVYSLGATFYELYTGRPFLDGTTEAQLVEQVLHRAPLAPAKANPAIPGDLATILEKATQKDRGQRYADAASLERDLDAFLGGRPISARAPTAIYRASLLVRRHTAAVLSLAVAAIAVVAAGVPALQRLYGPHACVLGDLADCAAQCERRHAGSCYTLGAMFEQGNGAPLDLVKAVDLYERGCDAGSTSACYRLGTMLEAGTGRAKDEASARSRYAWACDHGEGAGCNGLAILLTQGRGGPADAVKAVELYQRACDAHFSAGCSNLGIQYGKGEGVAQDLPRARALHTRACDEGSLSSCGILAIDYAEGKGGPKDEVKAAVLFDRACAAGHAFACGGLAGMKERGTGTAKDVAAAAELYRRACEGEPSACHNLGRLYEQGDGVPEDILRAIGLFARACESHVAEGCAELGTLLLEGKRVPRDAERARGLLHKACAAGVKDACETLAADAAAVDAGAPDAAAPAVHAVSAPRAPTPAPLHRKVQKLDF